MVSQHNAIGDCPDESSRPHILNMFREELPASTPSALQKDFAELAAVISRLEDLIRGEEWGTLLESRLSVLKRDINAMANEAQVTILNRPSAGKCTNQVVLTRVVGQRLPAVRCPARRSPESTPKPARVMTGRWGHHSPYPNTSSL
jgi:hypothetical protein